MVWHWVLVTASETRSAVASGTRGCATALGWPITRNKRSATLEDFLSKNSWVRISAAGEIRACVNDWSKKKKEAKLPVHCHPKDTSGV